MTHTIRPFDFSDADYRAAVTLRNRIYTDIPSTVEIWKHNDQSRRKDPSYHFFVAENQKGQLAAFVQCMRAGPASAKFSMGLVAKLKAWKNGAAGLLLDKVISTAKNHQVTTIVIKVQESDTNKFKFLKGQDFKTIMRYPISALNVASFDKAKLAQATLHKEVTISQLPKDWYLDPNKQKLVYELHCRLMQDIPHHEPREKKNFDSFLAEDIFHPNSLPESTFIAWSKEEAVGMTTFVKRGGATQTLATAITGVLPAFRRRGIATALKIASFDFAKSIKCKTIITNNEEHNQMFLLNQKLGFVTRPAWLDLQLTF